MRLLIWIKYTVRTEYKEKNIAGLITGAGMAELHSPPPGVQAVPGSILDKAPFFSIVDLGPWTFHCQTFTNTSYNPYKGPSAYSIAFCIQYSQQHWGTKNECWHVAAKQPPTGGAGHPMINLRRIRGKAFMRK